MVAFSKGRRVMAGSHEPLKVIQVGEYPEGIIAHPDGKRACCEQFDDRLDVIDVEALSVIGKIATGKSPRAFGQFMQP